MQVTKEIYEKVVKECNGDLDLAHDVVLRLYDYRCTSRYPGNIIKNIKKDVLDKRSKKPEYIGFDLSDLDILEKFLYEDINSSFLEFERKQLRENIATILLEIMQEDEGKSERNVEIIIEKFADGMTYREIADGFGISPEMARHIVERYLRKFRRASRAKCLKDFMFDSYL